MTRLIVHRHPMYGPLWTAEQGRAYVVLWAPNDQRERWKLAWTVTDEDGKRVHDSLSARHVGEFPARVPLEIQKPVGAVLNAAILWNPQEECDHTRALTFNRLADGRHVCGYCGRAFQPPERA